MTVPPTEGSDYLNEAAAELRKARSSNEARLNLVAGMHSGQQSEAAQVLAEVNARRMEIAAAFTRLAECQAAMLAAARMPDCLAAAAPADPQARSEP